VTGDLLTVTEAATRLGRSRGFIRALIADDAVRGVKRGGRWYVSRRSLDAWVDGGELEPNPGRVVTPPRSWVA
jgi:excisionase family DNA binding protein